MIWKMHLILCTFVCSKCKWSVISGVFILKIGVLLAGCRRQIIAITVAVVFAVAFHRILDAHHVCCRRWCYSSGHFLIYIFFVMLQQSYADMYPSTSNIHQINVQVANAAQSYSLYDAIIPQIQMSSFKPQFDEQKRAHKFHSCSMCAMKFARRTRLFCHMKVHYPNEKVCTDILEWWIFI
jgi:hypothetical protein